MPAWEYITTPLLIHNTAAILNNWGSEGWELVQIVQGPEGGLVAYLKRPVGGESSDGGLRRCRRRRSGRQAVRGRGLMGAEARLAELGIELPEVAPPVAAYVPAVVTGSYVYTSGQLPFVAGALPATGKVGDGHGLVPADDAKAYARTCALNALAAVRAELGSLDRVTRIVKVVGFVASDPSFTGQPGVINGASELLGEVFGEAGRHARSAVGVAALPLDAPVEVELVVEFA